MTSERFRGGCLLYVAACRVARGDFTGTSFGRPASIHGRVAHRRGEPVGPVPGSGT